MHITMNETEVYRRRYNLDKRFNVKIDEITTKKCCDFGHGGCTQDFNVDMFNTLYVKLPLPVT